MAQGKEMAVKIQTRLRMLYVFTEKNEGEQKKGEEKNIKWFNIAVMLSQCLNDNLHAIKHCTIKSLK